MMMYRRQCFSMHFLKDTCGHTMACFRPKAHPRPWFSLTCHA